MARPPFVTTLPDQLARGAKAVPRAYPESGPAVKAKGLPAGPRGLARAIDISTRDAPWAAI